MAQTGFTPISLYYSSTATNVPTNTNLAAGELAINTADGKLFYKDSSNVVQVIGTKGGGIGSSTTTQVLYNNAGVVVGNANLTTVSGSLNSTNTFGFKNRIINGAMVIDQRNAGASVTVTSGTYTLDRWYCASSVSSKYSVQQNAGSVTPPTGFTKYLGFTSLSAYSSGSTDNFNTTQSIEGFNVADLAWGTANAKTVTLSFQVYSSLTGTFSGSLQNSAVNRSYPFTFTISSASTWTPIAITIAGDTSGTWATDNSAGLNVTFNLGCGSTLLGTAGAWAGANYKGATGSTSVVGTNGATFYITGVQLETGSQATSFDFRNYGTELALCQRYCYRWTAGVAFSYVSLIRQYSTTNGTALVKLPVAMRGTISGSTIAINSANWDYSVTAINPVSNQSADNNYVQCDVTGTFAGASYCGALGSSGTAQANWIQWTSEL